MTCQIRERNRRNMGMPVIVEKIYPYRRDLPVKSCWAKCSGVWHSFSVADEIKESDGFTYGTKQTGAGNELNYEWAEKCPAFELETNEGERERVARFSFETLKSKVSDWQFDRLSKLKDFHNSDLQMAAIIGHTGTGKTWAANALLNHFSGIGVDVALIGLGDVLDLLSESLRYATMSDAKSKLHDLELKKLLIIDNVGKDDLVKSHLTKVGPVETFMDRRLVSTVQTIAITRNEEFDLTKKLGPGLYNKLFPDEGCLVCDLNRR